MPGLLDSLASGQWGGTDDQNGAMNRAIFALGAGLLSRTHGVPFTQALGDSLLGAQKQYDAYGKAQMDKKVREAQLVELQDQSKARQQKLAQQKQLQDYLNATEQDPQRRLLAMMAPEKYAEATLGLKAPSTASSFDAAGRPVTTQWDAATKSWVPIGGAKAPERTQIEKLLQASGIPEGSPAWNSAIRAGIDKLTTHPPGVNVRTEVKMGESIAGQIGPMLKAERDRTAGALNLGRSAERMLTALDSGKVMAGPGSSLKLFGAQVASALNIGGADNAQRIANTRQVVRALAESAVEARKELQGQGQVTENEAKAVEKALAGNIDDLTVDEIRLIAGLNIKRAQFQAGAYKSMLNNAPENLRPFYQLPGLDSKFTVPVTPPSPATGLGTPSVGGQIRSSGGVKFLGFE